MKQILNATKPVIGMLHVPALPGTPAHVLSIPEIISFVLREAEIYAQCDVDALLIENMHDVPYLKNQVGEEITAALTVVCLAVKQRYDLPCGVQILAAANRAALAVALAAGLQFIRAEGFVYAHIADEGYIESCAGDLLRYRKQIAASHIRIFTDIKKKHSAHTITADTSLAETIRTADFFRSDAIIITGSATGEEVNGDDLVTAQAATDLPVIIGSGLTRQNLPRLWDHADAFIVGSHFKENGVWSNPLSHERVSSFMAVAKQLDR